MVIASGSIVVGSNVKKVQHATGGIVGEILAQNGSQVAAGDIVVRLDATISTANRAVVRERLKNFKAFQEISTHVSEGGVIIMDQAAWHTTAMLEWPNNLSTLFIPPTERRWMRP